ncbi:type IV toxin-antitoxin system AbiEi family antitoxin domain-containing protein [Bifidobacterium callimiconis]|uniref:AbiEi antitoxin N-terminal domain-containing protein n=1 Tax=Bifidobacterium callimiconis TaxID=2306973 RepID=A0A430F7A7_9BIFI|nr:type IV toxin-antitoxin system AbiEi family antitoxin domain-containing protein [Bifidobacterium callimiconis]RSX47804.1 hypothetical protein D2E23_2237 [Bifidobacterium callimiconis]
MNRQSILQRLTPLMETQWGLVTTAQAQHLGIARSSMHRLETEGKLERLLKGVYRNTSVPSERFESLHAAWLSLYPEQTAEERLHNSPPDAVVSSHTAAWLLDIGDFVPEPYCFSTPTRKQTQRTGISIRSKKYDPESLTIREGLPVTTFEQTVADLVADNTDLSLVSSLFSSCTIEAYDNINRSYLEKLLAPYAKRNGFASGDGRGLLSALTAPVDDPIQQSIQIVQEQMSRTLSAQFQELQKALSSDILSLNLDSVHPMIEDIGKAQNKTISRGIQEILEAIRPTMSRSFLFPPLIGRHDSDSPTQQRNHDDDK